MVEERVQGKSAGQQELRYPRLIRRIQAAIIDGAILSIAFSPFIYVLLLLITYELVFRQMTIGPEKVPELESYARRRIWLSYGLRLKQLQAFSRDHAFDLRRMRTTTDVDNLLGVQAKQ